MEAYLPIIWALLLVLSVAMYVVLDGFDLGVGILFPWGRTPAERDHMMNSVAPVWDGNETWLVMGGGGLFAAFPLAYSVIMPAIYIPILLMLFALVFRGVAFEFRFKARRSQGVWDQAFFTGSFLAAFSQGIILGAFIQGFDVEGRAFAGGPLDWLTPFSLLTGLALVCGYALLGSTWLIVKTGGELQAWAYQAARVLLLIVLSWLVLVSIWTPMMEPVIAARWFSLPNLIILAPVPVLTVALAAGIWHGLNVGAEVRPFVLTVGLFLLGFLGLAVSLWPYAVPRVITLQQASAAPTSQMFLLVGTLILLPVVLAYTAHTYHVFRGKVDRQ
jgi:cytochrome d ubiquinol oxidase subunit II